ncbi:hypothetical protein ACERNI_13440 [Camelimonas sp. ID_303_24]
MASVVFQTVLGVPQGEPVAIRGNMRRLSTIAKRYANDCRPFMVSVIRAGDPVAVSDATVRPRKEWANTLVGKADTVLITYLPRGSGAQGKQAGKQIGMAVAAIALAIALPGIGAAVGLTGPVAALGGGVSGATVLQIGAAGIPVSQSVHLKRAHRPEESA